MSGDIEAAGAMATAGLVAGAIERKDPALAKEGEGACLNCGATLQGKFCHSCGQPARISRTLVDLVADAVYVLIQLDTRAWRTLPMVVARPGTITHNYIHGQRARYVSPLALFLFTVFLMFFVFNAAVEPALERAANQGAAAAASAGGRTDVADAEAALERARAQRDTANARLTAAEKEAADIRAAGGEDAESNARERIADAREAVTDAEAEYREAEQDLEKARAAEAVRQEALKRASDRLANAETKAAGTAPVVAGVAHVAKERVDAAAQPAPKAETDTGGGGVRNIKVNGVAVTGDGEERWQDQLRRSVESGEININTDNPGFNEKVRRALMNADLALYKLQDTASKYSFLLVPISLPFIALLFLWKRGVTLFDHVVFSLYSLSFMSLLLVTGILIGQIGDIGGPVAGLASIAAPTHMFYQLKGGYRLGWWSALWRTVALLFFAIFTLSLFATAILFLGILA